MAIIAYNEITLTDLIDSATYIYYADDINGGGASSDPTGKTYIGIYNGPALNDGQPDTPPTGTVWSKYTGDDGARLEVMYCTYDEIPPKPGASQGPNWYPSVPTSIPDGHDVYMSQKLSNETDWSDPIKISAAPTRNIRITGEQVFKSSDGGKSYLPNTITIKAECIGLTFDKWQYKNAEGTWTDVSNENNTALEVIQDAYYWNNNVASFKALTTNNEYYDIFTLYKVADGASGYTVILSNESINFPTDKNFKTLSRHLNTCSVEVYEGGKALTATSSSNPVKDYFYITQPDPGDAPIDAWVSFTDPPQILIQIDESSEIPASGAISFQIKIGKGDNEFETISKAISFAALVQGADGATGPKGDDGAAGRGIASITEEYNTTLTPDKAPTSWGNTVPTLSPTNKYLWNKETVQYTDGNEDVFIKIIGAYGDTGPSGANAIDFQIYSPTGYEFDDEKTSIVLNTIVLQKGIPVQDKCSYQWYYWDSNSVNANKYVEITSATQSTLTVASTAPYALSSIKCELTYKSGTVDEVKCEDHIFLTQKTDVYSLSVNFKNNTNIARVGEEFLIAYIDLYKNGQLLMPYNGVVDLRSIPMIIFQTEKITFDSDTGFFRVNGSYYTDSTEHFIYIAERKNTDDQKKIYNIHLVEYFGGLYKQVQQNYTYTNTIDANITSPVVLIPTSMINGAWLVSFDGLSVDRTKWLATSSVMVLDSNETVESDTPPASPKIGQFWRNTSVNPAILMMWNGTNWMEASYQSGRYTYTSQPKKYSEGDLWILSELFEEYIIDASINHTSQGTYYIKSEVNGVDFYEAVLLPNALYQGQTFYKRYKYRVGTILVASTSSETFSIEHWKYLDEAGDQQRENIDQYFKFDKEKGLKIGREDEKFYVQLDATEMGFYSNSIESGAVKMVSIGNTTATIKKANFEDGTLFKGPVEITSTNNSNGFVWQIENDGSLSLGVR